MEQSLLESRDSIKFFYGKREIDRQFGSRKWQTNTSPQFCSLRF